MPTILARHPRLAATFALFILSLVWGYNWVVSKRALTYAGALDFAAMRTLLAAASLFGVLAVMRQTSALKDVRGAFILGLLQTTAFISLTLLALVGGGAGRTAVLVYTMPTWVILFSHLVLRERTPPMQWLAVLLAIAGLALLFGAVPDATGWSLTLALLAAMFWAAGTVFAKQLQARRRCDVLVLTAWQMLLGGLPLALVALALPGPSIHWTPYFAFALAYNALLGGALAWTLWLFALAKLPAGVASLGTLLTPVIGVLAAWLELGEIPDAAELIGMLVIVGSLTLVSAQAIRDHRRVNPVMAQE
jgi:drug/metabolite transporter (DMT)-like permease